MIPFDFIPRTRFLFGPGRIEQIGGIARELGFRRTLFVADPGLVASGHVAPAVDLLIAAGVDVFPFHAFDENPDSAMVENGRAFAAPLEIDSLVGFGGGSSMDAAKGINFVLTNGGTIQDYQGYGKATRPLLPMIAVPTTAGTGSEAQSRAVIGDARTHVKMACGDPSAAFRTAILDPELTVTQPASVTAATGYDAIAHAVESWVTMRRNPMSDSWARAAWHLLEPNFPIVIARPGDLAARGAMQLGACFAGMAIEQSMLGATHACANPLTAQYGVPHGAAIAMLLPHVVRWNAPAADARYADLLADAGVDVTGAGPAHTLAQRLEELAERAGLRRTLAEAGVARDGLAGLAEEAAAQWTGGFNPRPFDAAGALEIYECAF